MKAARPLACCGEDPRVLFAAERTLLAWNRTAISLMAFGFLVERFGLFLQIVGRHEVQLLQRGVSFVIGAAFILLACAANVLAIVQFRRAVAGLGPGAVPPGYSTAAGVAANGVVALLGALLAVYLLYGLT